MKQRLRKKLGKLERLRAAGGVALHEVYDTPVLAVGEKMRPEAPGTPAAPALGGAPAAEAAPPRAVQRDRQFDKDALGSRECGEEEVSSVASCPAMFGMPIPVANTFVHFPVRREQVRRRSLSV